MTFLALIFACGDTGIPALGVMIAMLCDTAMVVTYFAFHCGT